MNIKLTVGMVSFGKIFWGKWEGNWGVVGNRRVNMKGKVKVCMFMRNN